MTIQRFDSKESESMIEAKVYPLLGSFADYSLATSPRNGCVGFAIDQCLDHTKNFAARQTIASRQYDSRSTHHMVDSSWSTHHRQLITRPTHHGVNPSHGRPITKSTHHSANSSHGQLIIGMTHH